MSSSLLLFSETGSYMQTVKFTKCLYFFSVVSFLVSAGFCFIWFGLLTISNLVGHKLAD